MSENVSAREMVGFWRCADTQAAAILLVIAAAHRTPWACWNYVELDFSRPGRPGDYAHIEAFDSILRRKSFSLYWFHDLEEAGSILSAWKDDYNEVGSHGAFAAKCRPVEGRHLEHNGNDAPVH